MEKVNELPKKKVNAAINRPKPLIGLVYFDCPYEEVAITFHTLARSRGFNYQVECHHNDVDIAHFYCINLDKRVFYRPNRKEESIQSWAEPYCNAKKVSTEKIFTYLASLPIVQKFKGQIITLDEVRGLAKSFGLI